MEITLDRSIKHLFEFIITSLKFCELNMTDSLVTFDIYCHPSSQRVPELSRVISMNLINFNEFES